MLDASAQRVQDLPPPKVGMGGMGGVSRRQLVLVLVLLPRYPGTLGLW